ncbi:hydantoinase/oxoprolinase family protein [Anaeroselena agilis]|uniref:Hydantoinase/oxoprolinase family protein n=1 Tax=Anaeroselena agilis TaxID=3063788 RepID=A0ABU3NVU0_9FIRM|nr:hydantoinase/oxoprolinase family protein [Selenomonadales bacterium 4137-cl]
MLLGIDVGGTYTDAVVVAEGKVIAQAKAPTTHDDLLAGILAALDRVLDGVDAAGLRRVALSTTIVTNAVVEGRLERVGLLLLPGPGMDISALVPERPRILSGYIDHRGRETAAPREAEVASACRDLDGCEVYAVAGKFAVRNPAHEQAVAGWLRRHARPAHITLGSAVAGSLNFWRRANSAYYNAAVWRHFGRFARAAQAAVAGRGVTAPVYILKADGGTMPLAAAGERPVEAVFTGPAASVLGIMALAAPRGEAVSLDIGGTTTDIALWRDGAPLFAERGAQIGDYPTAVRAFWLRSIGIGGDSFVRRENGRIIIGPEGRGPAMALGGPAPTVSDAMIVAGAAGFGDKDRAAEAMRLTAAGGETVQETARSVLAAAAEAIQAAIANMIDERASEPVYRVEDAVRDLRPQPAALIGVGGAAAGLAPLVAERLGIRCSVPEGAVVANAVGAAVARPTIEVTLRADTAQGYYTVAELGLRAALPSRRFTLANARELAARHLAERAAAAGIPVADVESVYDEEFNLVRGFSTTGKIIACQLQIKPGIFTAGEGV